MNNNSSVPVPVFDAKPTRKSSASQMQMSPGNSLTTSSDFFSDQPTYRSIGRVSAPPPVLMRASQDYNPKSFTVSPHSNSHLFQQTEKKQNVPKFSFNVEPSACMPPPLTHSNRNLLTPSVTPSNTQMANNAPQAANTWNIEINEINKIQPFQAKVLSCNHIFFPATTSTGDLLTTLKTRLGRFLQVNSQTCKILKQKVSNSNVQLLYLSDIETQTTLILSIYQSSGKMEGLIIEITRYSGCGLSCNNIMTKIFGALKGEVVQQVLNIHTNPTEVIRNQADFDMDSNESQSPAAFDLSLLNLPLITDIQTKTLDNIISGYKLLLSIYRQKAENCLRVNSCGRVHEYIVNSLLAVSKTNGQYSKEEILVIALGLQLIFKKLSVEVPGSDMKNGDVNVLKGVLTGFRGQRESLGNDVCHIADLCLTEIAVLY